MKVQRIEQARKIWQGYQARCPGGTNFILHPDTAHLTLVDDEPAKVVAEFAGQLAAVP